LPQFSVLLGGVPLKDRIWSVSKALTFDICKAAAWLDTEGNVRRIGEAIRATVVQKERAPLEQYSQFVSVEFRVKCVVERHGKKCWHVRHVATPKYLDAVEPFLETENKRFQLQKARQFYAERLFRRMFGIVKKGGRRRTTLTHETALLLWATRRKREAGKKQLVA
jgi:hypothetical protein